MYEQILQLYLDERLSKKKAQQGGEMGTDGC
jgi:hypothetical protein